MGAASVRSHCLNAECLGILNIPEREPEASASSRHPASEQPSPFPSCGNVLKYRTKRLQKSPKFRIINLYAEKKTLHHRNQNKMNQNIQRESEVCYERKKS